MKASTLISRYNHLNGKQITVANLKTFHQEIQRFLDSVGHGPLVKELKGIYERITNALKKSAGYEVIDRVELTPIDLNRPVPVSKPDKKKKKKAPAPKPVAKLQKKPSPKVVKKTKPSRPAKYTGNTKADLAGLDHGLDFIPYDHVKDYSDADGLGFTKEGQQKIYDMITGMILKVIKENKVLPWRKPWKIKSILATNFKTKTVYRGANLFLLNLIAPMFFGKVGPYWLTFKQVKDMGGSVKSGAKAFPVIYYSVYYSINKPTRKTITEEEYNAMTQQQRVEREAKELWTINYYNVFAQEDIEGIEFPTLAEKREGNHIDTAEAIVQGMPQRPDIQHHKIGRAFYAPGEDYIRVPEIGYFGSDQEYYSTLFHELVHSTGHPTRLDRFEGNKKVAPEGLDYDFEELIAEMGASYLNAEAGILYFTLKNSAAYLKGWQKKLEDAMSDDNKFFLKASAKAAHAADFILNRKETKVAEPPKSTHESKSPRPPVERKERSKAIQERSKKPAAAMAGFSKKLSGVVGADQLAGLTFKEIPLDGEWKSEFNRLMSDTQIMIWGVPGSGKTVKLLKFAQYLAAKGLPTLYVANEEFGRSSFTEKIREFNIGHEQLKFAKHLPEDMSEFQAIFLDSVQSIGMDLDGYKKFREMYPNKLTVAIIQSTKDGDFRGGKDWEHEVDIAGEVISRKLRMRKNRLDPDHESKAEKIEIEHMVNEKTKSQKIKEKVKQKIETQKQAA